MLSWIEMELVLKCLEGAVQSTVQRHEMTSEHRLKNRWTEYNVSQRNPVAGVTRGFLAWEKVQILLSSGTAEYVIS